MNIKPAQLSCLILGTDENSRQQVRSWMKDRRQVSHLELCDSSISLQREMARRQYDLVALITAESTPIVPSCLYHYPDTKLVIFTIGRKTPSIDKWIGQGIEEAVSLTQPEHARRVLFRLLDERVMAHRLALLESQIDEQWGLIDTLIAQRKDAVALNQDGKLLQVNRAFTNMTGLNAGASKELWLEWLDGPSKLSVQSGRASDLQSLIVKDLSSGKARRLDRVAVQYCGADAELIVMDSVLEQVEIELDSIIESAPAKKRGIAPMQLPTTATDSATGLPARSTLLHKAQRLLQGSDRTHRYTAMLVRLLGDNNAKNAQGIDRTVQDLTLYRAADALQKNFSDDTVLGRISQNALLLIKASDETEPSRGAAKRVRDILGSLGGIIENPSDLKIDTLNVAGASLSADEVLARLEKRHTEPKTAHN